MVHANIGDDPREFVFWPQDSRKKRNPPTHLLEPIEAIIETAWSVRPSAVIHIGALRFYEGSMSTLQLESMLRSIALASIAAYTLKVPFIYLSPVGPKGLPATPKGMQALLGEDQLGHEALIVRMNGLFGPDIDNQIRGWVLSETLVVDDQRRVNPVPQQNVERLLRYMAESRGEVLSPFYAGGPTTTWYDFFLDADITTVKPWAGTKSQRTQREYLYEWDGYDIEPTMGPSQAVLKEWYFRFRQ
jgi:hypothetical protein